MTTTTEPMIIWTVEVRFESDEGTNVKFTCYTSRDSAKEHFEAIANEYSDLCDEIKTSDYFSCVDVLNKTRISAWLCDHYVWSQSKYGKAK